MWCHTSFIVSGPKLPYNLLPLVFCIGHDMRCEIPLWVVVPVPFPKRLLLCKGIKPFERIPMRTFRPK